MRLVIGIILAVAAASAHAQQCSPEQMSQIEIALGNTLVSKALAETRLREAQAAIAELKKELEAAKKKPDEKAEPPK